MKVKGLENKIYRLSPYSINFYVGLLSKLKDLKNGKIVDLSQEDAGDLLIRGFVEKVKSSKKGDK